MISPEPPGAATRRHSAAAHASYDTGIAANFEMSAHTGRLIASLARPRFGPADPAPHMREDDVVIGVVHGEEARAYPIWIVDYYHVINTTQGGDPVVIASCERCQTGAAFLARIDGHRIRLYAAGMYNATLMLREPRRPGEDEESTWIHYEGVCVAGPRRGRTLPILPTFHATWAAWRRDHPDTLVLAPPQDRRLRDSRDGHGREEFFSRPGIEIALVSTIAGTLDRRYPENEMVLGIHLEAGTRGYPLREVKASGRVVEDEVGGEPVVVFAGPGQEDFAMACYARTIDGRILAFRRAEGGFADRETGTTWSIEGVGIAGPLAGRHLDPVPSSYLRWHAWVYFHPDTILYQGTRATWPDVPHADCAGFAPLLAGLERLGRRIEVEDGIVRPRLPHEAEEGLRVVVGGEPLNLYRFRSGAAAADWAAYAGAMACRPIFYKHARKRHARAGTYVVESDPETQYADPAQIVRLPDPEVSWSEIVWRPDLVAAWAAGLEEEPGDEVTFAGLFAHLADAGYEVVEVAFLPPVQLRPGTVSAVEATIAGDVFEVFKCEDAEQALRLAGELTRAVAADCFVLRSAPPDRFHDMKYEIGERSDARVAWSDLLEDPDLPRAVETYVAGVKLPTAERSPSG